MSDRIFPGTAQLRVFAPAVNINRLCCTWKKFCPTLSTTTLTVLTLVGASTLIGKFLARVLLHTHYTSCILFSIKYSRRMMFHGTIHRRCWRTSKPANKISTITPVVHSRTDGNISKNSWMTDSDYKISPLFSERIDLISTLFMRTRNTYIDINERTM